jgi:hypothetical protein
MNIDYTLLAQQKEHLNAVIHDLVDWTKADPSGDAVEALVGILHLLDALGDEHEDAQPADAAMQSTTMQVRFRPQAWIKDNAVDVDLDDRPNVWFIEAASEGRVRTYIEKDMYLDFLKHDSFAPWWIREYAGPFEIELIES